TLQARKRRDGAARAHDRLFPAPHELQRLDEELRFPNAAGPELEIALGRLRELAPRALEQIGEAEGEAGLDRVAVDEGREDLALDERAERAVAGDGAGAQQRGAFPEASPGLVVALRRRHRVHERPARALRAQPQVDAPHEAF